MSGQFSVLIISIVRCLSASKKTDFTVDLQWHNYKPGPTQAWALASELGEKENSSLQFMVPAMVTRFN